MTNRDSAIQHIKHLARYHPDGFRFVGDVVLFVLDKKPNVPSKQWSNYLNSITSLFMLAAQGKPAGEPLNPNVDRTGRIVFISFPRSWMKEIERP